MCFVFLQAAVSVPEDSLYASLQWLVKDDVVSTCSSFIPVSLSGRLFIIAFVSVHLLSCIYLYLFSEMHAHENECVCVCCVCVCVVCVCVWCVCVCVVCVCVCLCACCVCVCDAVKTCRCEYMSILQTACSLCVCKTVHLCA